MKKITVILCLLITSFGFSQTIVEDFDPLLPGTAFFNDDNGNPLGTIAQVPDPAVGGTRGNVLQLVTTNASVPWQGAGLILQGPLLDLTNDPIDPDEKKVNIWVFSNTSTPILAKVTNGVSGAPDSATDAFHGGSGWEQLTFDFQNCRDNTAAANGIYQRIRFFPAWNNTGPCNSSHWPPNGATPLTEIFIDQISFGAPVVTTWTGGVNSDWATAGNWDNGVPTASLSAIIPNVANAPTASGAITAADIFIESGASLIANSTVTGTVTYERNLPSSNWHYISSPVIGQDVDNFVAASNLQSGGLDASLCTFDTAANDWNFYQIGTANADVLNAGQGYIVNLTEASGDISFSGTMNVGNVSKPLATTGQGYNLLGNPYPSYIDSSAMLTGSSGSLLSQTIWVWNQAINDYEEKVTADNFQLAPGQGFFIQSNGAAGNVAINEAFQSHQATDTFLRSAERTEVYLSLTNGSETKQCKLYYMAGTTTGFDNGFDGPKFRAFPEPLSIYTHLVTNNFGMDIGLQSLPNDDYENLVIPVGIDAIAGTEITVSASSLNLPVGIDIYFEDRLLNTFTLLNENSDYMLTPINDLNGTGRFYLHTSSDTLGLNENALAYNLQIYTTDASKQVIIKGQLSSEITKADLYDLQGKLVLSKTLDQTRTTNTLDTSGLSSGLYVVKVEGGNQSKTQKVLIK